MTEKKNPQTEANKRWQQKNRERARYLRNRSSARSFIRGQATIEDLEELSILFAARKEFLEKNN
ncbi:hypothetical protein [uncultured Clostridium sp.]|jgi:hypothetical protein|uniref:hypothetical protein n=1 Tax=uncultured Clostridium sp. TaxID=59620 RepID=UPI002624EFEE|nr:hypothetical protein [uncultured Clostridium sp.]